MNREYDEILDSARDYRILLSAMARPGSIHDFSGGAWNAPPGVSDAFAAIALALLDSGTSFAPAGISAETERYLTTRTRCRQVTCEEADFLLLGSAEANEDKLAVAKRGLLEYPDQGATVVAELTGMAAEPAPGTIAISASGPGIDGTARFHVRGVHPVWLATLRACNAEFPLGVDAIFTCGSRFVCLPRSASFEWK